MRRKEWCHQVCLEKLWKPRRHDNRSLGRGVNAEPTAYGKEVVTTVLTFGYPSNMMPCNLCTF